LKVRELIQELLPFKDRNLEIVVVDNNETLVSKNISVCLTTDYLIDSDDKKYISAITQDNDNLVGEVAYIELKDFYMEEDYWKNNKCDQ